MARGRRPDNSLEPSRQLLTQRAFRQRRAAHLAELEDKVNRLERENASLKGIDYVEIKTKKRDGGNKRVKLEKDESRRNDKLDDDDEDDEDDEDDDVGLVSPTPCEKCAILEREKLELMRAAASVEFYYTPFSEAMQTLRNTLRIQQNQAIKVFSPSGVPFSPASRHITTKQSPYQPQPSSSPQYATQTYIEMQPINRYNNEHSGSSSSSTPSRLGHGPTADSTPRTSASFDHVFSETTQKAAPKRHQKSSSNQSQSYANNYDRAQDGSGQQQSTNGKYINNQSSNHSSHLSSLEAPAPSAPARSCGSGAGCNPSGLSSSPSSAGARSCSTNNKTMGPLVKGRASTIAQALEVKPLQINPVPQHLTALQQQQHYQHHPYPQHEQQQQQYSSPRHQGQAVQHQAYHAFTAPQHPMSMSRQREASNLKNTSISEQSIEVDDTKCCLGFFECDTEGNLIVPDGMATS